MDQVKRPFTARQIIGVVLIFMGLNQLTGFVILMIYVFLQHLADNVIFPMDNSIQRFATYFAFAFILFLGVFMLLLGVLMLRDKNGKPIKFLRN